MKSNPTKKIKQGPCAYCRAVGDVTDDHVIPQCLWGGKAPSDAPVVDACPQCNNNGKSGNDTYLRDLLINEREALESPHAQKLWGKHLRAVNRNQSEMDRDRRNHGKVVMTLRPSGLLTPYFLVGVAEKRTRDIISLMVRGLHSYYLHELLSQNTSFQIGRLRSEEQIEGFSRDIAGYTEEYHRGASVAVGDGAVFSCAYVELMRDEHITLWQLHFYGNVTFGAMTNTIQIKHTAPDETE